MAYTPCPNTQVGMNAVKDCFNPAIAGMLIQAIGFAYKDIVSITRGTTAETKNQVAAITLAATAKTFVVEAGGEVPWADTTEEFDPASNAFNKTVAFTAPEHGAGFSGNFIEPILKNKDGYVFILQRKDKNGDCAFPIIGLEKGAVGVTGTLNYTDDPSAGCYVLTLTEALAPSAEMDLYVAGGADTTDYQATLEYFNTLVAKSY